MDKNFHRYLTKNADVVLSVIDSTDMVKELQRVHGTSATMTAAMGEAVTAASLMGYGLKDKDNSLTLTIKGNGPSGKITVVSDWLGNVRCCCDNPAAELAPLPGGNMDVAGAVGSEGTLYVVKDLGMDNPYVGELALSTGDIANEVTRYYAVSEQIPTVCALGYIIDKDLTIKASGGYMLQLLPFCPEEVIDIIEKNMSSMEALSSMLGTEDYYDTVANKLLEGLEPNFIDITEAAYKCSCSRDKMEKVLISLGKEELEALASESEDTEIICHFCRTKYNFSADELRKLAAE